MYSSVITLANSIIGVSILAMPYCYKQCGIILATLMVILSGTIVKVACHLLIKSAIMARRRNIENLAFHTHGPVGKLLVELGIIGYLIGTSIAFFVVMGDLGPPLMAKLAGIEETYNLRLIILTGLGLFVALPLSMLRNIESLQIICASSIMFYLTVVVRVVLEAAPVLSSGHWLEGVALWRPAGILQCFPIFSMALACQANVFEVYSCLPDPSPQKMNLVVKGAVNLCSGLYITIGFFGYLAFHAHDFGGNILTSFTPTTRFVDLLKLGFVISVAVSFPLVVFPCRTSIHSLIFRKTYQGIGSTELVTDYIPPARFNLITFGVIVLTLCIGIVVPDIELVLGIVGSTMGSSICVIFPAVAFLKLTSKNTTERLAAKGALVIGIITLILGTYVNLVEHTSAPTQEYQQRFGQPKPVYVPSQDGVVPPPLAEGENIIKNGEAVIDKIVDHQNNIKDKEEKVDTNKKEEMKDAESVNNIPKSVEEEPENKRQEPAVPEEPESIQKPEVDDKKSEYANSSSSDANKNKSSDQPEQKNDSEKELEKEDAKNKKSTDKEKLDAEELLKEMKKYKQEQESVLQEQKKILSELKQHQLEDVAKKEQNQQQPVPAQTNNSAAAAQLPPQSVGQVPGGQLSANQVSGDQVAGANSLALQAKASLQGQQQQVVETGGQPIAAPPQVKNQLGQSAQLQQQPIQNQQFVGQQQPVQIQQSVPQQQQLAGQQPVQYQQPMQQQVQNQQLPQQSVQNQQQPQQPIQNQQLPQQPVQNQQQPVQNQQQPIQNQQLPQQPVQNQQLLQQQFQKQQILQQPDQIQQLNQQPDQNQQLPQLPVQNQQILQQPVQNQQLPQQSVQNQQILQQPDQNQQLPQQPIQNPKYQGQQMQPVINQGYAAPGSYNAQFQANNQQIVQQPQLQNIPQQQLNNNYNQMNVQQSNQKVQLQNIQSPQQISNNQPQPQQQMFDNQPQQMQMAAYSPNGNNNLNLGLNSNHEVGVEIPNANRKIQNLAEVQGQANLQQGQGLGGAYDNNIKSGRDFKKNDHDVDRDRRGALCENDPNCAAKFDRNPLEDSPLSQDLLRLQYIGGKRNLQEERSNRVNGNNSVKDEYL